MQVSQIWLCCPSAFNPAVGPSVVSEAGEPASPKAAAADRTIIIDGILNPNFTQIGTYKTAKIGIVPKEVPIFSWRQNYTLLSNKQKLNQIIL